MLSRRSFGVPLLGSLTALAALSILFITLMLAVGYTFSTIAQNQLQAMQMSMMFFLPNILLSGFMFPYAGMPGWGSCVTEFTCGGVAEDGRSTVQDWNVYSQGGVAQSSISG